ncbi:MAG: D-amino-acid oxidase [Arcobacter sp.]|nr:MAG: D-amino-acid oxidase [Arcobacter sp.]
MKIYDYVIIGSGIAGSCIANELKDESLLILEKNPKNAQGASGAAGAFLNPLLGKNNNFKTLVNECLLYANTFYEKLIPESFFKVGVLRIPKNEEERKKFEAFKEENDFDYIPKKDGYFFDVASHVLAVEVCNALIKNIEIKCDYDVKHINFKNELWHINDEIFCKNLILTTGKDCNLFDEKYINIRPVWGEKIDISSTTCIPYNTHKACSVSSSFKVLEEGSYKISIGATHHRFTTYEEEIKYLEELDSFNKTYTHNDTKCLQSSDSVGLLEKANDILPLKDVRILDIKRGARACSFDYLPLIGPVIDSKKTLHSYPYLKKGTKVPSSKFSRYEKLFILNGLGGRGFVMAPYLSKILVDHIKNNTELPNDITLDRLFMRWVRKEK